MRLLPISALGVIPPNPTFKFNDKSLTAGDCYRFVLANSMLDACMMGVRNMTMLEENLQEIEEGPLDTEQLDAMRRIGDHLYGKSR